MSIWISWEVSENPGSRLDSEHKFSSKCNRVLFGIRNIFSNGMELSFMGHKKEGIVILDYVHLTLNWVVSAEGLIEFQVHQYKKGVWWAKGIERGQAGSQGVEGADNETSEEHLEISSSLVCLSEIQSFLWLI